MSEGPQVRLKTERLHQYLAGHEILRCDSPRPDLADFTARVVGRRALRAFCKGKHIFIEFEDGLFLHNHLLMRGIWRKLTGQLLFLPPGTWLGLYVGPHTVCNLNGQVLHAATAAEVERSLAALGPDTMATPFPAMELKAALGGSELPVGEALMEQSLLCGIGNVAKSEALFLAGIAPGQPACELSDSSLARLALCIEGVMWKSYRDGGRWTHRVYHRAGQRCPNCGGRIRMIRQGRAGRSTFFCSSCQQPG